VSRSLQACEGALLVVDASQGIEAQTLANVWLAIENNLEIIPVINKIDLPGADPDKVKAEIEEIIGIDASDALLCSAKTGVGIDEILEAVVTRVPAPKDNRKLLPRALIFDSYYDQYLGVVCQFRVIDGMFTKRDTIQFFNTGKSCLVTDLWVSAPARVDVDCLYAGEVGCVAGAIKSVLVRPSNHSTTDITFNSRSCPGGWRRAASVLCWTQCCAAETSKLRSGSENTCEPPHFGPTYALLLAMAPPLLAWLARLATLASPSCEPLLNMAAHPSCCSHACGNRDPMALIPTKSGSSF
jgi:translation elongation factor EF-4